MPSTTPKKSAGSRSPSKGRSHRSSAAGRSTRSKSRKSPSGPAGADHPATATLPILGHCGGRPLHSALERDVCDQLTSLGIVHTHRPRHFEVTLEDGSLAAFAPTMVVRGRGREGKSVVVEVAEEADSLHVEKVRAFRRQYGVEFYVCMVGTEEVIEDLRLDAYDECSPLSHMHTMVSRLAD